MNRSIYLLIVLVIAVAAGFSFTVSGPALSKSTIVQLPPEIPVAQIAPTPALPAPSPPVVKSNGGLEAVGIVFSLSPEPDEEERIEVSSKKKTSSIDVGLGAGIDGKPVNLYLSPGETREFKVEQQYENSMTISDEGPHLDLTDWKHFTSEWTPLESIGQNKFRSLTLEERDRARFPKVTQAEIYSAVLKRGGKRWAELAKTCKGPDDGWCIVTTSRISFRISALTGGNWVVVHQVDLNMPMGC